MARNLLSTVGQSPVDNLTRDNLIFQNRIEVTLPAGTWSRGMALVLGADGSSATRPVAATTVIDAILLEDIGEVDTGESAKAAASLTGQFNQNSVDFGAIPDANLATVIATTRATRQLDIAPMHQAPYIQFGGDN